MKATETKENKELTYEEILSKVPEDGEMCVLTDERIKDNVIVCNERIGYFLANCIQITKQYKNAMEQMGISD